MLTLKQLKNHFKKDDIIVITEGDEGDINSVVYALRDFNRNIIYNFIETIYEENVDKGDIFVDIDPDSFVDWLVDNGFVKRIKNKEYYIPYVIEIRKYKRWKRDQKKVNHEKE